MSKKTIVTREIYKTAKDLFDRGYSVAVVMHLSGLSQATVYRIKAAKSYKGANGYIHIQRPAKNKYDNVMSDYIELPQRPWWRRITRGKNVQKV